MTSNLDVRWPSRRYVAIWVVTQVGQTASPDARKPIIPPILSHPNIAALFEYYEHDGIGFLIMEYVPSKSLADLYHEQNGPMDPIKLLPILIQTARGLFVAHSHGVIHRDVKPANIMVSDSGEVKITDFGVSYSTNQEQITQDGMVVGTAQYISPEQAQGKHATPQSDIYSLGVVAYEGLCGHRPFTGATPVDIAAAHVNNPVPPPARHRRCAVA